jgi:hypothetical protein
MSISRIWLGLAFGAVACSAWGQLDPGATVASVNGEDIKMDEYVHRLEWYRVEPSSPLNSLPVGFLALNQMITERLVLQLAKDKGVAPSDPQIDAEEKSEIAHSPTLLTELQADGRTEQDLRQGIAYNLAQYNLQTYGITITDQEVEQHYKANLGDYTIDKQYKLRVIVVEDDAGQAAVDQDLAAGKAFADVASARSIDLTKGQGGEYGLVQESHLGGPTVAALQSIKIGQVTPWVRGKDSDSLRVKYLIEDIVPSKVLPLDDDLRVQIRRKLSLDKGAIKNSVMKDLQAATASAKVVISIPGFQKRYDAIAAQSKAAGASGS